MGCVEGVAVPLLCPPQWCPLGRGRAEQPNAFQKISCKWLRTVIHIKLIKPLLVSQGRNPDAAVYLFWISPFSPPPRFLLTFSSRRFLKGQGHLAVFGSRAWRGPAPHLVLERWCQPRCPDISRSEADLGLQLWDHCGWGQVLALLGVPCCPGGVLELCSFGMGAAPLLPAMSLQRPAPHLGPPPHTSVSPALQRDKRETRSPASMLLPRGSQQGVGKESGSTLAPMAELGPW